MVEASLEPLAMLDEGDYVRQRADPRPGDGLYLHLSDLALALRRHASQEKLRVLDLGCGGSPYRSLFPNARYQRADLEGGSDIDFRIGADGRVNAPSECFDLVLSTQVLEHCPDPAVYLSEARRILRPGGRILLTTHGVFEDHGCPFDFRRWTCDGLERELSNAGFDVLQCQKLTTRGRAIAFLLERHGYWLNGPRQSAFGLISRAAQRALFCRPAWFHSWCDSSFAENRVVDGRVDGHSVYIAILIVGVRKD